MILLLSSALAGFYHPSDVAAASSTFASASEANADRAGELQRKARALAAGLVAFEEAAHLLGKPVPPRHATIEKQFNRDLAVLQAFVDDQVTAFDAAFTGALERALANHADAQRCQREIAAGRQLPGMPARVEKNPECQGDDLNPALAEALDGDTQLQADLKALAEREWPALDIEPEPLPFRGKRWIDASSFFRSAMPDALAKIRDQDEEARLSFQAAIEQGATKDELKGMVDQARAVDEKTAAARRDLAAPVLERVDALLKKNAANVSFCIQPAALGGCAGTDATQATTEMLLADKKLRKVLR